MKRQATKYLVVALLSFLVGGWYFINHQSNPTSLIKNTTSIQTAYAASTGSMSVPDIVDSVGPAVVYIEAESSSANGRGSLGFYGGNTPQQIKNATGTGFIIDSNGYILTNQHVIDGAKNIKVTLQGKDNPFNATVVGKDYELDLAILKIDASNLQTVPMGDSDIMRPGDSVIAIGNPLGLDHTVTTGVVSAKGRPITIQDRNYKNLIQTDAAINPGNSGGPLINIQGQVIAINTAISTDGQGIGFAIPINTAKSIMQELMTSGKVIRPYLGISMADITPEVASQLQISQNTKGTVIAKVLTNSPAAQAGVKYMDVMVSIDGNQVSNGVQVQDYIQKQQVGQTVKLGILRNNQSLTISVTLKEQS